MEAMNRTKLVSLFVGAAFVLAACGGEQPTPAPQPTQPPAPTAPAVQPVEATATPVPTPVPEAQYNEAPELAALVKEGKLPP